MISKILKIEASAILATAQAFERGCESFCEAVFRAWLRECEQVVFVGVGKSGHIARKAAASFASIGVRSYFIHAAELMHGDLGNICERTLVVMLSFSGRGAEILSAHAQLARRTKMLLSLAAPGSALARGCAMNLPLECAEAIEDMPAPTASTTLTLALCDGLLAIAVSEFALGAADFGRHHPGGALGKRYYERVRDCLQPACCVRANASLREAIAAMAGKGYAVLVGATGGAETGDGGAAGANGAVVGFLSDGDLRRALAAADFSLDNLAINYASKSPVAVAPEMLAHDARELAKARQISTLLVLENGALLGVMRLL